MAFVRSAANGRLCHLGSQRQIPILCDLYYRRRVERWFLLVQVRCSDVAKKALRQALTMGIRRQFHHKFCRCRRAT
jgi:hypothetical protein